MMQVNATHLKPSVSGFNPTSNLNTDVLTSTILTASMMVQHSLSLTSNEALAAEDIQIALNSYCSVKLFQNQSFLYVF